MCYTFCTELRTDNCSQPILTQKQKTTSKIATTQKNHKTAELQKVNCIIERDRCIGQFVKNVVFIEHKIPILACMNFILEAEVPIEPPSATTTTTIGISATSPTFTTPFGKKRANVATTPSTNRKNKKNKTKDSAPSEPIILQDPQVNIKNKSFFLD